MVAEIQNARRKSLAWGALGGAFLLGVYFALVSLANSFSHAVEAFAQIWYWVAALTVGFGIQVGLYTHVRQTIRLKAQARGATHAGSLDFRVGEIAGVSVNGKEVRIPATWEGSPPGGHHRSGSLRYENLPADVSTITLRLSTGSRADVRRFEWKL